MSFEPCWLCGKEPCRCGHQRWCKVEHEGACAVRPKLREDGIPTRSDRSLHSGAEHEITLAMQSVESMGASRALTDAVIALGHARSRVADHVEGNGDEVFSTPFLNSLLERLSGLFSPFDSRPLEEQLLTAIDNLFAERDHFKKKWRNAVDPTRG